MKKRILLPLTAIAITLSTSAFTAQRDDQQKNNEIIGLSSGATAGALVGGPLGAMIGGIIGVLIADDVNDEHALQISKKELASTQSQLQRQDSQLAALQRQYEQAKQQNQIQLVAMDQEIERVMQEIESHVLFRTASHNIEEHFKPQLDLVANGLKNNPQWVVTLSGYADSRGDDAYNQVLSQQRALNVKEYLVAQGVNSKQVLTSSYGETQPVSAQQNREDFFFDRRVLVRVSQGQQSMTASNL
ncbi:sortase-associated OmpA-like protein PdsO [Aliiglaciecola litoralis]|uniref:Sortase-associated OmpA-like protein PdsO n=1 Tax=Aliiglaciecola litoralis TaxID=582857 RepID=A0ABN1LEJ1_9ALTE